MAEKTGDNPAGATISVGDAAKLLMVDERWIQKLAADNWIQKAAPGRYGTVSVVQGYIRFLKDSHAKQSQNASANKLRDAKARAVEIANSKDENRLVDIEEVEAVIDELLTLIRSGCEGVPASVTRDRAFRDKIEGAINDVFTRAVARVRETLSALRSSGAALDSDPEAEPG